MPRVAVPHRCRPFLVTALQPQLRVHLLSMGHLSSAISPLQSAFIEPPASAAPFSSPPDKGQSVWCHLGNANQNSSGLTLRELNLLLILTTWTHTQERFERGGLLPGLVGGLSTPSANGGEAKKSPTTTTTVDHHDYGVFVRPSPIGGGGQGREGKGSKKKREGGQKTEGGR